MAYCAGRLSARRAVRVAQEASDLLLNHRIHFCYEYNAFPCASLENGSARHKKNYRTSLIEHLTFFERYSLAEIDTLLANGSKTKSIVIIIDFARWFLTQRPV